MNEERKLFYGKYQAIVTNNKDPDKLGRLKTKAQDVLGDLELNWALPSTPYAGKGVGLFLIPPINTLVWIEFQQGDPDYPIWTGCFWGKANEVPTLLPAERGDPEIKILKTELCTIKLDDSGPNKGITIRTEFQNERMEIVMDAKGIHITASQQIEIIAKTTPVRPAKIVLNSGTVSINGNALEVT